MILFASDFGLSGPYVGQVHAVLARWAPGVPVIDLMHDLPPFRPAGAGCLIGAMADALAASRYDGSRDRAGTVGEVVLAVVDPGVGTARDPIIIEDSGTRYVGPDNGLFAQIVAGGAAQAWRIDWRPEHLSDSFHGRDLFAPVAAMLAQGRPVASTSVPTDELVRPESRGPLAEIIYCDRYGNAMTGIEGRNVPDDAAVQIGEHRFGRARTFGEVPAGTGFWYANSLGLVEIAVNQGDAARQFGLTVGLPVAVR